MSCCCSRFCSATERQFNQQVAARDVARYRRKGPPATTRLLRDGLRAAGPLTGTLLDIGSGIGALTFELLEIGVQHAVAVDASEAYVTAGRHEADRRGRAHAVDWKHGDFVSRALEFQPATVVTLDRVVCCYPVHERLLLEAVRRAERWLALSYPRDRWYVRVGMALENAGRRLAGNPFRTFVHPPAVMERLIRGGGFRLVSRRNTAVWCVDIYAKADAVTSLTSNP
ncbi:MAG: class I SAM-dependent methyltransferase [Acidobacteria bacterium]|nr:class I SAM-dependent methyltransferase [Acidobacteriota bacterium]